MYLHELVGQNLFEPVTLEQLWRNNKLLDKSDQIPVFRISVKILLVVIRQTKWFQVFLHPEAHR